ncbi:hypothetical protein [Xanthomonas campestris]|uniref:hypothetical protein n=1 Tax=Xanthomonas campestris TaxID=339 RepID=UPI001CD7FDBF|nr:hypothetical protein [Xanthomonas campestris]MCW1979457.1 branched-subunit amino acid ABC-type transport system permease component [Xanthomonas campestris]
MSTAPHPANAQLQALAQAHQHGQLDRAQYRARRRSVLDAARQAQGVTLRNALPTAAGGQSSLPGERTQQRKWGRRLIAIFVSVIFVTLILLIFRKCTSGFDPRSASDAVSCANCRVIAPVRTTSATGHVGLALQRIVLEEMDECV